MIHLMLGVESLGFLAVRSSGQIIVLAELHVLLRDFHGSCMAVSQYQKSRYLECQLL